MSSDKERYDAAAHAMQTGVAFSRDLKEQEPKHLRVGINAAMSDHGALVNLLIKKGVITLDEYMAEAVDYMEKEAESYKKKLEAETGRKVTLK